MNNDIINYIAYFILISTTFGHISTKSYETLSLFIATFILVHKIYDNIVLSTIISISLSSFYKTFINKKEGMEDHHEIINQTRNQHLGISTNGNGSSDTSNGSSDASNGSSDASNGSSDASNASSDASNGSSTDASSTDASFNDASFNDASSGSYGDMLEDSDESAESTYNNTITNVDGSSYSCKAHNNSSPAAVALCDAGHQKVSTDICSTGCAASQKINGFYVCCVGNCPVCGGTISGNKGYNAATGETTTEYTGGAKSSYYTRSDTDGDGEDETTYISQDRWDLWAQQLRSDAALALQDISDNTNIFTTTLLWDACANGIHSYLYNIEESILPDDETTSVPGTSGTGKIIRISRFAKPDPCTDDDDSDFNPCNEDLESIANVRYRLGEYYYNNAPPDNYTDDNWKLAARQFNMVDKLVDFVLDNHSYTTTTSPFTGKRKTSGFSSNNQLRKRINNSKIKKETTTISHAIMSAWDAFKNEIRAN
tara:strand:- start:3140 stop:4597 length:1458 start_codon:yes stop_codon:yes gene_type:complete